MTEYQAEKARWAQLALASFGNLCNAVMWITFAPVTSLAEAYYKVPTINIVLLSVVYLALYVPGSFFASYIFGKYGLKQGVRLGVALNFVAAWIRFFSADQGTSPTYDGAYGVLIFGQIIAAVAQPFFTNLPARFASTWFTVEQRDIAATAFTLSNVLGIALGSIIPSFFTDVDAETIDMWLLLLVESIMVTLSSALVAIFYREEPEQPPSKTQAEKRAERAAGETASGKEELIKVWSEIKTAFSNKDFVFITIAAAVGLGFFNTLTTLVETITRKAGYTTDDASLFSGAFIGVGLIAAIIAGIIMDKTHKYITILRVLSAVAFLAVVGLVLVIRPDQLGVVTFFFALLGVMLPILPLAFEISAECTHPVSEDVTTGIIMASGQVTGIIYLFVFEYLISEQPDFVDADSFSYEFTPTYIISVVSMFLFFIFAVAFNGEYKRLNSEELESKESEKVQATESI